VWRRRRLRRLEQEVAAARVAQAALQRRLEAFEQIAAAAGVRVSADDNTDTSLQPVPATLIAAAREAHEKGSPVRLPVNGGEVIAVIGDEGGDPREWWAAIHRLAARLRSAS